MDKYSSNLTLNDKSINGVLGSRTRGGRMEATFKSTELRRHPPRKCFFTQNFDLELNKIFFVRSNSKSGNDSIKKILLFKIYATLCQSNLIGCSYFFPQKWAIPHLFFYIFVLALQFTVENVLYKSLPMTGFEPRTSGVWSDHSTNWATTTAHNCLTNRNAYNSR